MSARKVISLSAMEKIIKNASNSRVSDEAKESLREALEEFGEKIAKEADVLSKHANRRTIMSEDIKMSLRAVR
jgi:histone H3/H4